MVSVLKELRRRDQGKCSEGTKEERPRKAGVLLELRRRGQGKCSEETKEKGPR